MDRTPFSLTSYVILKQRGGRAFLDPHSSARVCAALREKTPLTNQPVSRPVLTKPIDNSTRINKYWVRSFILACRGAVALSTFRLRCTRPSVHISYSLDLSEPCHCLSWRRRVIPRPTTLK